MVFPQWLNNCRIFKWLAKAVIILRICAGWSEPLLVPYTHFVGNLMSRLKYSDTVLNFEQILLTTSWGVKNVMANSVNPDQTALSGAGWSWCMLFVEAYLCKTFGPRSGLGAQWLSGRVLDSRPRGPRFKPQRRHCVVVLEQDTFILV